MELGQYSNTVHVQYCRNCSSHNWCTHHNQAKYQQNFQKLFQLLKQHCPQVEVQGNKIPTNLVPIKINQNKFYDQNQNKCINFPQTGSFQVKFRGRIIFSKKNSNTWPNFRQILNQISMISKGQPLDPQFMKTGTTKQEDTDKLTEKGSIKNQNIYQDIDKRSTFCKTNKNDNFTLTDHFRLYNKRESNSNCKYEQGQRSQPIPLIRHSSNLKDLKTNLKTLQYKEDKSHISKKKNQKLRQNKQMIVKLDSIEQQSIHQNENSSKNYSKKNNIQSNYLMNRWNQQLCELEKKFKKFQDKVEIIKRRTNEYQRTSPKLSQDCLNGMLSKQSKRNSKGFGQLQDKFNGSLRISEKDIEQVDIYRQNRRNTTTISSQKLKKIQDYLNGTEEEKNQRLKKIYGEWKIIKPNFRNSKNKRKVKEGNEVIQESDCSSEENSSLSSNSSQNESIHKIQNVQKGYNTLQKIKEKFKNSKKSLLQQTKFKDKIKQYKIKESKNKQNIKSNTSNDFYKANTIINKTKKTQQAKKAIQSDHKKPNQLRYTVDKDSERQTKTIKHQVKGQNRFNSIQLKFNKQKQNETKKNLRSPQKLNNFIQQSLKFKNQDKKMINERENNKFTPTQLEKKLLKNKKMISSLKKQEKAHQQRNNLFDIKKTNKRSKQQRQKERQKKDQNVSKSQQSSQIQKNQQENDFHSSEKSISSSQISQQTQQKIYKKVKKNSQQSEKQEQSKQLSFRQRLELIESKDKKTNKKLLKNQKETQKQQQKKIKLSDNKNNKNQNSKRSSSYSSQSEQIINQRRQKNIKTSNKMKDNKNKLKNNINLNNKEQKSKQKQHQFNEQNYQKLNSNYSKYSKLTTKQINKVNKKQNSLNQSSEVLQASQSQNQSLSQSQSQSQFQSPAKQNYNILQLIKNKPSTQQMERNKQTSQYQKQINLVKKPAKNKQKDINKKYQLQQKQSKNFQRKGNKKEIKQFQKSKEFHQKKNDLQLKQQKFKRNNSNISSQQSESENDKQQKLKRNIENKQQEDNQKSIIILKKTQEIKTSQFKNHRKSKMEPQYQQEKKLKLKKNKQNKAAKQSQQQAEIDEKKPKSKKNKQNKAAKQSQQQAEIDEKKPKSKKNKQNKAAKQSQQQAEIDEKKPKSKKNKQNKAAKQSQQQAEIDEKKPKSKKNKQNKAVKQSQQQAEIDEKKPKSKKNKQNKAAKQSQQQAEIDEKKPKSKKNKQNKVVKQSQQQAEIDEKKPKSKKNKQNKAVKQSQQQAEIDEKKPKSKKNKQNKVVKQSQQQAEIDEKKPKSKKNKQNQLSDQDKVKILLSEEIDILAEQQNTFDLNNLQNNQRKTMQDQPSKLVKNQDNSNKIMNQQNLNPLIGQDNTKQQLQNQKQISDKPSHQKIDSEGQIDQYKMEDLIKQCDPKYQKDNVQRQVSQNKKINRPSNIQLIDIGVQKDQIQEKSVQTEFFTKKSKKIKQKIKKKSTKFQEKANKQIKSQSKLLEQQKQENAHQIQQSLQKVNFERAKILNQIYGFTIEKQSLNFLKYRQQNSNQIDIPFDSLTFGCEWVSLHSLYKNQPIFTKKSIAPSSIIYGAKNILNFRQIVKILGQKNELAIIRLFEDIQNFNQSHYGVWLCDRYQWKCVTINSMIPVESQSRLPYFSMHKDKQLWPIILEKAMAKLVGGYKTLQKMSVNQLFHMLTGSNYLTFRMKEQYSKNFKFVSFLSQNENKNFIIYADKQSVNLQEDEKKQKQVSIYYVLSQKVINNKQILIRVKQGNSEPFWIKFEVFINQFNYVSVLQLRLNHNFTMIELNEDNHINNYQIAELKFQQASFGAITLSNPLREGYLRVFLYREEENNILRLVGQAKQKSKFKLFFDCMFSRGRYYIFADTQHSNSRLSYMGEGNPILFVKQNIHSDQLKNNLTQYVPVSMLPKERSSFQASLPMTINMESSGNIFRETQNSFGSNFGKKDQRRMEKLKQQFISYLRNNRQ